MRAAFDDLAFFDDEDAIRGADGGEAVGDDEADPASGLISFSAPLSRAVLDAEVGDFVDFAGKTDAIEIVSITVRNE